MSSSESIIADVVHRVDSVATRHDLQNDVLASLRELAFEEFLIKVNLGVALYSGQGHFFYASHSLSRLLGYSLEVTYEKGPRLLHELTTPNDKPLVSRMLEQSEEALRKITHPVSHPRISFDYHIISSGGILKRVYQHLLPNAFICNGASHTLFLLHDFTGLKASHVLNYRVSHLDNEDRFITIHSGQEGPPCPFLFTRREKEVLKSLADGKPAKLIADESYISMHTLKRHRSNILKKSGSKNMMALISDCLQNGWLENRSI